jgi:hypothetical protein
VRYGQIRSGLQFHLIDSDGAEMAAPMCGRPWQRFYHIFTIATPNQYVTCKNCLRVLAAGSRKK